MRYAIMGATVQQVRNAGATDIKEARSSGIIFANLTESQAAYLRSRGCTVREVKGVKASPVVRPPTPVPAEAIYTPQGIVELSGLEQLRAVTRPMLYGKAMNIAIIDSGIRETHEQIQGSVIYRKNFTSDAMEDGLDHGTGVGSIVLAVAPQGNILNLKVLNSRGEGTEEAVVLAIDECIALRSANPSFAPSVINLSLGAPDDGNPNNILRVACRAAIDRGIWVAASAGNDGPTLGTISSPACERYVLAVGSLKCPAPEVSDFSSRGPTKEGLIKPDTVFFGEDIVMASSRGDTATKANAGTSFSAPFCSGLALLYQEAMLKYQGVEFAEDLPGPDYPEITEAVSVKDLLDRYIGEVCTKPQGVVPGKDNDYGYGLIWGPFVQTAFGAAMPIFDMSTVMSPLVSIIGLGIVTTSLGKVFRSML